MLEKICECLVTGGSIKSVCKPDHMPSYQAVYLEMSQNPEFANAIARAREAQQEYEMDTCIEMADAATTGDWQVAKLRIWARQWRAAKLAPKKYGDRLLSEVTGPNGSPIEVNTSVVDARSMTPEEREAMRQILLAARARKEAE